MLPEISTIVTASVAALVAGIVSYIAGLGLKRREWRLQLARERLASRERLYVEFLALATGHALQAIEQKTNAPTAFLAITEKREQIMLVSSKNVADRADELWEAALDAHLEGTVIGDSKFAEIKSAFAREARLELVRLEAKP